MDNSQIKQNQLEKALKIELQKAGFSDIQSDEFLEKARSGVYADTPENRKKGRVGSKFGAEKKTEESNSNSSQPKSLADTYTGDGYVNNFAITEDKQKEINSHNNKVRGDQRDHFQKYVNGLPEHHEVKNPKEGDEFNHQGSLATVTKVGKDGSFSAVRHESKGDKGLKVEPNGEAKTYGKFKEGTKLDMHGDPRLHKIGKQPHQPESGDSKNKEPKLTKDQHEHYERIQEWSGNDLSKEKIHKVISHAEDNKLSLHHPSGAKSQEHESELVHEKVKRLHQQAGKIDGVSDREHKDILYGALMAHKYK